MTTHKIESVVVDSNSEAMESALSTIRTYVTNAAKQAGLTDADIHRLRLAVDEITTNIIVHGYHESGLTGQIKATASIDDQQLSIDLEDTAIQFDPRAQEAPQNLADPLDSRPIGGLGIFLAINNVDAFDYERIDNRNVNRFCMKRLNTAGG